MLTNAMAKSDPSTSIWLVNTLWYPSYSLPLTDKHHLFIYSFVFRMSSEEKRRKREEMLDFAQQRDKERISNVQKYLRQDAEEKERGGIQDRHVGFIQ